MKRCALLGIPLLLVAGLGSEFQPDERWRGAESTPSAPPPARAPAARLARILRAHESLATASVAVPSSAAAGPAPARDHATQLGHLYDEMSELLESTPDDCEALEFGMSTLLQTMPREIEAARLEQGSGSDRVAVEELRALLKGKLERMRAAFALALPNCSRQLATELGRARRAGEGQGE